MTPDKRIVLHTLTGAFAGLYRIVGTVSQLTATLGDEDLPGRLEHVDLGDHQAAVIHAGTTPRYVLYREFADAPRGRLNEFHPAQV